MVVKGGGQRQAPSVLGAYGFEIAGLDDGSRLLGPAESGWPRLHVVRDSAGGAPPPDGVVPGTVTVGEENAEIWLTGSDRVLIDRASFTVRFATGVLLADEVIAHPYIALPASIASRWLGRQILHAAAFRHAGKVWALLGEKEAGKSSLVGWLHHRGYEILTDDILVVEDGVAFSGPRCVDLRPESAAVLGGEDVGMLGNRVRWRLRPGAVPSSAPLAGLVHLEWGDRVSVEPLHGPERLSGLIHHSVLRPAPADSAPYLHLAGLPTLRFVRPRDLGALERTNAQLLDALA